MLWTARQDLFAAQVPVAGGAVPILGAIPDGTTITATNTDGSPAPITRSGAAFSVSIDPDLAAVTIHETTGTTVTIPAPNQRGAPNGTTNISRDLAGHSEDQP